MKPSDYQLIGSYLDIALIFFVSAIGFIIPKKLVDKKGTEEERAKKIKLIKISSILLFLVATIKLLIKIIFAH